VTNQYRKTFGLTHQALGDFVREVTVGLSCDARTMSYARLIAHLSSKEIWFELPGAGDLVQASQVSHLSCKVAHTTCLRIIQAHQMFEDWRQTHLL
jgi:hypothetical protein